MSIGITGNVDLKKPKLMQNRKQSRVQDFFDGDFAVKVFLYDPAF